MIEKLFDAKKRLSMTAKYDFLRENFLASGMNDFVVVDYYASTKSCMKDTYHQYDSSEKHVYSFLTDIETLDESILDFSDVHEEKCCQYLSREDAFPSFGWERGDQNEREDYYERIGGHHRLFPGQIYPLTYHREFNTNKFDARGKYNVIEICEDFRHFHGLYPKGIDVGPVDKYYKETELNIEESVVVVVDKLKSEEKQSVTSRGDIIEDYDEGYCEVKIRKQDLFRYLHYTQRALIVQFEFGENIRYSFEELDEIEEVKLDSNFQLKGNEFCKIQGAVKYGTNHGSVSWSILKGLAILLPPPMGDGYSQQDAVKFCVGLDNRGNEKYLVLDDNWMCLSLEEKTKDIYFNSAMLDHFYENNGSEYIIYDRFDDRSPPLDRDILICSSDEYQFKIPLSFHNDDVVYCSVEELGRPKKDLLHFQKYNIPLPSISERNTRFRDLEVSLKQAYYSCRREILNLSDGENESSFLKEIRIPQKVDQKCFDRLILQIVKLLIEGIKKENFGNFVRENSKNGKPYKWEKMGTIDALAVLFRELVEEGWEKHIDFLRALQNYRNMVAHAKPENWTGSLKNIDVSTSDLRGGLAKIFEKSISFLQVLK